MLKLWKLRSILSKLKKIQPLLKGRPPVKTLLVVFVLVVIQGLYMAEFGVLWFPSDDSFVEVLAPDDPIIRSVLELFENIGK